MRSLPVERFVFGEWRKARVNIDHHVEIAGHYYSAPYQLVGQAVEVRISGGTVECYLAGRRVASHVRSSVMGRHTTLAEHMPRAHRDYAHWTPERLIRWAAKAGPAVAEMVEAILGSRAHPQHGFRPCLGIMRLGQKYGDERLEAACRRALEIGSKHYKSVRSILDKGLEQRLAEEPVQSALPLAHDNVRGAAYYGSEAPEVAPC